MLTNAINRVPAVAHLFDYYTIVYDIYDCHYKSKWSDERGLWRLLIWLSEDETEIIVRLNIQGAMRKLYMQKSYSMPPNDDYWKDKILCDLRTMTATLVQDVVK